MIQLKCDKSDFVNDLVELSRSYGWNGDYIEIHNFVTNTIENFGLKVDEYNLEPYDEQ